MERVVLWAAAEEDRLLSLERINRKSLRNASQPVLLAGSSSIDNFRLSKSVFRTLCHSPALNGCASRNKGITALQYYASGGYQRNVGNDYKLGLAQQTVSDCIEKVTNALNEHAILRKYIKFPRTKSERVEVSRGFMDKFGFPGVLGCIDGTHIAIIRPKDSEEAYFNRKYYHLLNVMLVCDACDASFGDASHDSHVWNSSPLKREMERLHSQGDSYWFWETLDTPNALG